MGAVIARQDINFLKKHMVRFLESVCIGPSSLLLAVNGQLSEIAIYRFASSEMVPVVWESIKQLAMELAGAFAGSLPIF